MEGFCQQPVDHEYSWHHTVLDAAAVDEGRSEKSIQLPWRPIKTFGDHTGPLCYYLIAGNSTESRPAPHIAKLIRGSSLEWYPVFDVQTPFITV